MASDNWRLNNTRLKKRSQVDSTYRPRVNVRTLVGCYSIDSPSAKLFRVVSIFFTIKLLS